MTQCIFFENIQPVFVSLVPYMVSYQAQCMCFVIKSKQIKVYQIEEQITQIFSWVMMIIAILKCIC